jgi:hypothetical protein
LRTALDAYAVPFVLTSEEFRDLRANDASHDALGSLQDRHRNSVRAEGRRYLQTDVTIETPARQPRRRNVSAAAIAVCPPPTDDD